MSIKPGLERIHRLLKGFSPTWKPIHVAGTNGKGSVCAYLQSMLAQAKIRTGCFTSPHLIDAFDGIQIDREPIRESLYRRIEDVFQKRNTNGNINASPYEVLTATAFEAFNQERVDVGVIECGIGGRLDSTNILEHPIATVITSISMDHQAFLGGTLREIASHKAGIIKQGVPVVVDGHNDPSALDEIHKWADEAKVQPIVVGSVDSPAEWYCDQLQGIGITNPTSIPPHQRRNMLLAYHALQSSHLDGLPVVKTLASAMRNVTVPGRLQTIDLAPIVGREYSALLDGAHNDGAWNALAQHVNSMREQAHTNSVTWVLAASQGKNVQQMARCLLQPTDNVVTVQFGSVAGMPFVKPVSGTELAGHVTTGNRSITDCGSDVEAGLKKGVELADGGPVVIAGSLYLVSDVLRLLRDRARTN